MKKIIKFILSFFIHPDKNRKLMVILFSKKWWNKPYSLKASAVIWVVYFAIVLILYIFELKKV